MASGVFYLVDIREQTDKHKEGKEFGEKNSFRIGGDSRLVVLIIDENEEEIQAKIDHMQVLIE